MNDEPTQAQEDDVDRRHANMMHGRPVDADAREDELEAKHKELVQGASTLPRWAVVTIVGFLVTVVAVFTIGLLALFEGLDRLEDVAVATRTVATDTNDVVAGDLTARDETIDAQQIVIDQAVVYVTVMGIMLEQAGVNPPLVQLNPALPVPTPEEVIASATPGGTG